MRNVLREVEQANWQCAKDKNTPDKYELILLREAILDCVVNGQRCYHEQKHEVDEEENRPYPLPAELQGLRSGHPDCEENCFHESSP